MAADARRAPEGVRKLRPPSGKRLLCRSVVDQSGRRSFGFKLLPRFVGASCCRKAGLRVDETVDADRNESKHGQHTATGPRCRERVVDVFSVVEVEDVERFVEG